MVRTNKKKGGGGGGHNHHDVGGGGGMLDEKAVHKAIQAELVVLKKQLTLEPVLDNTEKQVKLIQAILRMNIAALLGTVDETKNATMSAERRAAVDKLLEVTNAFDQTPHSADTIDIEARAALNDLSDTFRVFGNEWGSVRDAIVNLALDQIEEIKTKDPLEREKAELEKLEKKDRELQIKSEQERRERAKSEKEQRRKKKKNKKNGGGGGEAEEVEDYGESRVPPATQPVCEHATCRCKERSPDYDSESPLAEDAASECFTFVPSDPSRSSISTEAIMISGKVVLSQIMSDEYWSQFCYFYDNGSK